MTNSEKICEEIGNIFFYKELVKSNLIYITDKKEEKELADVLMRVDNYILAIQIKEKTSDNSDVNKWLNSKVYKVAKNQIKETINEIKNKINFKNEYNKNIIENIDSCIIIPIIIFDIGSSTIDYNKVYYSESQNLVINIFDIKDFQIMCENLISPMELVRYLNERKEYVKNEILIFENKNKTIIGKTSSENALLNFYSEKYELEHNTDNIKKLNIFNNYLTLFEEHCILNKDNYEIFIKYLSSLFTKEIYCFIDRLNVIIEKGFKKQLYFNNYIISENHKILFISLPKEKYNLDFINFVCNVFMYYFKINNLLAIINYAIDSEKYELDFAMCEYDGTNEDLYLEAIKDGMSACWEKGINSLI